MDDNKENNINTQTENVDVSADKKTTANKSDDNKPPKKAEGKKNGSSVQKSSDKGKKAKSKAPLKVVENTGKKVPAAAKKKSDKGFPVKKIIFAAAAIVILIIIFFASKNSVVKIGEKQVMFSQEYTMNSKSDFHVCGDNIYYVSKDGMILLNKKGDSVWTDTFTMASPVMLCDGEYSAVADNKSKTVNVYNLSGKLYSITAGGDITSFAVNPQGCCAVVCKSEDDYKIDVYSDAGEQMFEGSYASSDGIPLAADISDDGKLLAVSLVNISDINMKSSVLFYYTTKSEAQNTESSDGMISAVNCGEDISGVIRFLPDNSCVVATDNRIMNIGGENTDSYLQNWEIPYTNYVTAMDIVDDKYIALAYGEPVSVNGEAKPANSIYWYNTKGKEVGKALCDEKITSISSSLGSSIAYMGKNFKAFTVKGRELWSYTALQNVESIQFYNTQDTIVLATATKMNLLDVRKGAEMEEASPEAKDIELKDNKEENDEPERSAEPTAKAETEKSDEQTTKAAEEKTSDAQNET